MGSQQSKKERVTELESVSSTVEDYYQEYYEVRDCCGYKYKKAIKSLLIWQQNLIHNCTDLQKVYPWAVLIRNFVKDKKISRLKFIRQFNDLKYQQSQPVFNGSQAILSNAEVQKFKQNLKKSVLISYSNLTKKNQCKDSLQIQSAITLPGYGKSHKRKQHYLQQFNRSTIIRDNVRGSNTQIRSSIRSFIDDTMANLFREQKQQVSKEGAHSLQIFVKFTMILQKHLNDKDNKLHYIMQIMYGYLYKKYPAKKIISDLEIEDLTKQIKIFLVLLRNAVQEYYNTKSFLDMEEKCNCLISNSENLLTTVTTIFFKDSNFYRFIYMLSKSVNREREENFKSILKKLNKKPPQYFEISPGYCLNNLTVKYYIEGMSVQSGIQDFHFEDLESNSDQPYIKCIQALRQLQKAKNPIAKMKAIMQCSQKITQSISQFYNINNMNVKHKILDADQVLSIFCYIIAAAKIEDIHTHLFIVENFATDHQMISETGYYFSVITGAIEQLQKLHSGQSI